MEHLYKIVVAGCGAMSNTWLDYLAELPDAKVVGLVDINKQAAVNMAEKRQLSAPAFDSLEQALAEVDANLVIDVTIPASHKHVVTTALRAGCNVLGEKPIAETLEEAREVVAVANETGKRYIVMQNRRFLKQIRAFHELLHGGEVGTLGSLHADFFLGPHFGGFRDAMNSPLIVDMAIHTFDQARYLLNADPVSVYCHEYNPPGSWYEGNASAICIFEMSNGTVFSYRGSWCAEGLNTSWESDWRATGSKGSVRWDGHTLPYGEAVDETATEPAFLRSQVKLAAVDSWQGREGHAGCLDEMFAALAENRLAETECTDNIKSVAMVFAAVQSAQTGQKVYIDR